MPKILIEFDPRDGQYYFHESWEGEPGQNDAVVHIKSSTYKRFQRNYKRIAEDQEILHRFFMEAQMAGREICER